MGLLIASRTRHALLGQLPRHLTSRRTPCSDPAQDAPLPIEAQGLWRAGRLVLSAAKPRKEGVNGKEGGSRSGGEFCLLVFYRPLSLRSWHAVPLSFRSKGGGTGWLVGSSSRRPCAFRARWGDGAGQCGHPPAPALSGHHPLRRGAPASLPLGADTATSRAVAPSHIHNLWLAPASIHPVQVAAPSVFLAERLPDAPLYGY